LPAKKPVRLAMLWHMHQPYYYSADKNKFQLPWVRLHALKDYLDMPLMTAKYERVKATFNLVPSLIDQLEMYLNGIEDNHLLLSKIRTEQLSHDQKHQILNSFFSCPQKTMIEPYPRYFSLFEKYTQNKNTENPNNIFSKDEILDIQVWSNLVWVDPMFRNEPIIKYLIEKNSNYTEDDKVKLLDWQLRHMSNIIPSYKTLFQQDKIDISFSPYYHPILPLLIDSSSAKEALPNIKLPEECFNHPIDAEKQISMAKEKYESLFEKPMIGMWPSEGSVSEETAVLLKKHGVKWIATDEEVLFNSIKKSNKNLDTNLKYRIHNYNGLNILFRDHNLSDKIGFEYSRLDTERAVDDFIDHLHHIRVSNESELENLIVPVILDGENAWEYYINDGNDFLDLLYSKLNDDELIEMVTFTESSNKLKSEKLNSLFAGSWINSNFKIWIGHPEDNKAWNILYETRKYLADFEKDNPSFDSLRIEQAWKQIYIAEGSDWCWWYGDEHRGFQNDEFDMLFRSHLIQVYEILDLPVPSKLNYTIHKTTFTQKILQPDNFIIPSIDGKISHFFEWNGSGYFNQLVTSGAMTRTDKYIKSLYFGFDENNLYIRLDFIDRKNVEFKERFKIVLTIYQPVEMKFDFYLDKQNYDNDILFASDDIIEIGIPRRLIIDKNEDIDFDIEIYLDNIKIEKCPEYEPIKLKIPKPGDEIFWPM
jgi:alpha-amylase/alpha-mannosidase (GH57 family)